jgi:hypothetical protein
MMATLYSEIRVPPGDSLQEHVSLAGLTGRRVADVLGRITMQNGEPTFVLSTILLSDGSSLTCEGAIDLAYAVPDEPAPPNMDSASLRNLYERGSTDGVVHIYQLNDCDWVAANTMEQGIAWYLELVGGTREHDIENPRELSDVELDTQTFRDVDGKYGPENGRYTFREGLRLMLSSISERERPPFLFCSTEY